MLMRAMRQFGFTLIEMMVVVAIIGILATISIPIIMLEVHRDELEEAIIMSERLKSDVNRYYNLNQSFPYDNAEAGMPASAKLIGNKISGVNIQDGAIHIRLGNKIASSLQGKTLTYRPAVVIDSPASPITWLCGYDEPVNGMQAIGDNQTDIIAARLPTDCQKRVVN